MHLGGSRRHNVDNTGVGGSNRAMYVNSGETGLVAKNVGSHKAGYEF